MDDPRRGYSIETANAIVRLAIERQDPEERISHDELLETASEIGVSAADIEEAVAEEIQIRQAKVEVIARRRRLKEQFLVHLITFAVADVALWVIDRTISGGTWYYWPLLGWGTIVAVHAAVLLFPRTEPEVTRGESRARIDAAFNATQRRGSDT